MTFDIIKLIKISYPLKKTFVFFLSLEFDASLSNNTYLMLWQIRLKIVQFLLLTVPLNPTETLSYVVELPRGFRLDTSDT